MQKAVIGRSKNRRNYNIGPLSLPSMRTWSLKFEVSTIGPSSLKTELY